MVRRTGIRSLDHAVHEHLVALCKQVGDAAALGQDGEVEHLLTSLESTVHDLEVLVRGHSDITAIVDRAAS